MLKKRIAVFIVLSVLIYIAPWWVALLGACVAALFFDSYFELLLIFVAVDALYSGNTARLFGIHYGIAIISLPLFLGLATLRRRIRV